MKTGFSRFGQRLFISFFQSFRRYSPAVLFYILLSAAGAPVMAANTVATVDQRVSVRYAEGKLEPRSNTYTTKVSIKNLSAAPIFSPLRLAITNIDDKQIRLLDADGIGADGLPYREFPLANGLLPAGQATVEMTLVFSKEKGGLLPAGTGVAGHRLPFALTHRVSAAIAQAVLEPRAMPYALNPNSGKVPVRFSVRIAGNSNSASLVTLRRVDTRQVFTMNDRGKDGDLKAGDGIYGAKITIDTSTLKAETCLPFEALLQTPSQAEKRAGLATVASPVYRLCVSSFPLRIAGSSKTNQVKLDDGSSVVSNEIVVHTVSGTREAQIRSLATEIHARVVGSLLPKDIYQMRLSAPLNASQLAALLKRVQARKEVKRAFFNAVGGPALTPSDTEFSNQHGLTRVRAHDVWDINATGNGVTVAVLDTGIDRSHTDFGVVGDCQLADNDCGASNTDFDGATSHGTGVAGVLAAKTNNALGVAGVAPNSKIKAILVGTDVSYTIGEMQQSFLDAEAYGAATVVNASFSGGPWALVNVTDLCASVNAAVLNGVTPVAIAVAATGNNNSNGFFYPARCNDSTRPEHAALTRKDLLISVANSLSTTTIDPLCSPATVLDERCGNSNYGAWTDITAPGMSTRTTAAGGGYAYRTGTSFSAPMVSGAAAILSSCGVPLDQIESRLRTSALATVTFPDASSAPRLDIFRAMQQLNHAPTAVLSSGGAINENTDTSAGIETGTLTAVDLDTCDRFTYSIVGGADAAVFSIGGVSADRLLLTAGMLDFETKPSYTVRVRVTDFFEQFFEQDLTVNVIGVNEPPAGTDATKPMNEDAIYTFAAADFGFTDISDAPPNNLNGVIISTLPAAGLLKLGVVNVVAGQTITAVNIANLTFTPAANANGIGYASFTFQIMDDGGTANGGVNTDPSPNTLTFNVTPANDPPTGLPSIDGTLTVGQTLTANTGTIADIDGPAVLVFSYQWLRDSTDIAGATGSTYTLVAADFGMVANLRVCYTDAGGSLACLTTLNATTTGDPHLRTVDGLRFDFQAAGEFVALRGVDGMELQTRQTPVSTAGPLADNYSGLPVGVSINTAIAARVGKHRVTFQPQISGNPLLSASPGSSGLTLRIDGVVRTLPANGIDLGSGGYVYPTSAGGILINFPDSTQVLVTPGWWSTHSVWYLNLNVYHAQARSGIMGAREKRSWLPVLSDGSSLGAMPAAMHDRYLDLYVKFADSWRVTKKTGLFDYDPGTSTQSFTLSEWPRENPPHTVPQGVVAKPATRDVALKACQDVRGQQPHDDCVFDVMVTGNTGFAKTYLLVQQQQDRLTTTTVRNGKGVSEPNEPVVITATVKRTTATVTRQEPAGKNEPAGYVLFTLDGKRLGELVALDAKGHATWKMPGLKAGQYRIGARYIPAKGSELMGSSSMDVAHLVKDVKR